jgi:hypothetical protein
MEARRTSWSRAGRSVYRKSGEEALNAGWAAARQWLDGGRIPWKAKPSA